MSKRTKSGTSDNNSIKTQYLLWGLPILAGLVYLQTVNFDFVLDDFAYIVENENFHSGWDAIISFFTDSYYGGFEKNNTSFYRPLPISISFVIYKLGGGGPRILHLFQIIFFAICVYTLIRFLIDFGVSKKIWIPASLIFILHPVHTEVVCNIKSIDELLIFAFTFSAFIYFIQYLKYAKNHQLIISIFLYFLALLCKESALSFFLFFPIIHYFKSKSNTGLIKTLGFF
jgi:hypothetical protein